MTFSIVLMGWGGAQGLSPVVGIFFFVGPVLLLFAMVFEWIMGNFFASESSLPLLSSTTGFGKALFVLWERLVISMKEDSVRYWGKERKS
jgi:hypothetical protein